MWRWIWMEILGPFLWIPDGHEDAGDAKGLDCDPPEESDRAW